MAYEDFVQRLREHYGSHEDDLSPARRKHFSFAKNTNWRGQKFIALMNSMAKINWKNTRILDVGCAYGGFCVEAAKLGAETCGIDIVPRNHELALLNAKGEDGRIRFELCDATSRDFRRRIPSKHFDLIIVHDVFEHVYDTTSLLENLGHAAADRCAIYFMIPNGKSLRFVEREGHKGIPGISLLPPPLWSTMLGSSYSIYYRPWRYFVALFKEFGFEHVRTTNSAAQGFTREGMLHEHNRISKTLEAYALDQGAPEDFRKAVAEAYSGFSYELQDDSENLSRGELYWKYGVDFWEGFAFKGVPMFKVAEAK